MINSFSSDSQEKVQKVIALSETKKILVEAEEVKVEISIDQAKAEVEVLEIKDLTPEENFLKVVSEPKINVISSDEN